MTQPHLGQQLREIRTRLGYGIAEAATETGISASFLSLVEKGRSDISIGRLMRLTRFYGVGLADVLPPADTGTPEVIRAGEHRQILSRDEQMNVRLLTNHGRHAMRPILATYEVGGHTSEHLRQEGDVFVYVISGEITIDLEDQSIVLTAGDSAYLDSGTPRLYRNAGSEPATMIGVLERSSASSPGGAVSSTSTDLHEPGADAPDAQPS